MSRSAVADPVARLAGELTRSPAPPSRSSVPADAEHGDYATNVALKLAGLQQRPPREIADEIAAQVVEDGIATRAEAAGPGFVNLWVSDAWLADGVGRSSPQGTTSGRARLRSGSGSRSSSSPPTRPGRSPWRAPGTERTATRLRGSCPSRDTGSSASTTTTTQVRRWSRFHASVEAVRRGEAPPEDGYQGEYIAELATLPGDPADAMVERIEESLERFRIHFDTWTRETEVEPEIPEAVALLDTFEEEGAVWARTSAHGDDKDRVLVRSGGEPTYFAKDAAYMRRKYARGFDRLIYVLGADHHGYVARLQALAEMLGHPRESLEVLVYQLVHLVEGGAAKMMSKRRGDVVFLDELVDAIGVDAARWYLVSRGHDQTIELDVDLAKERTNKNPVYYVQYAHARIAGILRNAEGSEPASGSVGDHVPLAPEERELVKRLLEFPAVVAQATERRAPHAVPIYAIRVADDFHRFYHEHRVLESEQEAFRLGLVRAVQLVIARCLDLVGVDAPERM